MSEELYFNNELRNCLDAAVYSDCGENDQWNYWYQRLRKAHDAAVDRVTETQRAENAKLRELVRDMNACIEALCSMVENSPGCSMCPTNQDEERPCAAADVYCRMRDLGVDA